MILAVRIYSSLPYCHVMIALNVHPPFESFPALVPEVHLCGVEVDKDLFELES